MTLLHRNQKLLKELGNPPLQGPVQTQGGGIKGMMVLITEGGRDCRVEFKRNGIANRFLNISPKKENNSRSFRCCSDSILTIPQFSEISRMPCIRQHYHHSMDIRLQQGLLLFDSYCLLPFFKFYVYYYSKWLILRGYYRKINFGVNILPILTIVINAGRQ